MTSTFESFKTVNIHNVFYWAIACKIKIAYIHTQNTDNVSYSKVQQFFDVFLGYANMYFKWHIK